MNVSDDPSTIPEGWVGPDSGDTLTPEEYLRAERVAERKADYFAGRTYAFAGASRRHNLIVANLIAALHAQLRDSPCDVYASDMRLRVSATGLYTYPDVSVVCGAPQLEDEYLDTLLNPTVLIEVLSPSTEPYDRMMKAEHYRRLDSLWEYLLVRQDEPQIEWYRRHEGEWVLTERRALDAIVELAAISCTLPLSDVYARAF